jgi:DNA N-6-adenine-methyltransferase (Dam)
MNTTATASIKPLTNSPDIQSILGDAWQPCQLIKLPKPSATMPCDGWTIGIVLREGGMTKMYLHHPAHDGWLLEYAEVQPVAKRAKFNAGIAAVQQLIRHLPPADSKYLELPAAPVSIFDLPPSTLEGYLRLPPDKRPKYHQRIKIELPRTDGDTQRRNAIDPAVVAKYTSLILYGTVLPRIKVVWDGQFLWIYDGFHTRFAHINAEATELDCDVIYGTLEEAQDLSLIVNSDHGQPLSNADKFAKVQWALGQERHQKKSNEAIAKICAVSAPFVASVKSRLNFEDDGERIVTRADGSTYTQQTANIGRRGFNEIREKYDGWGDFGHSFNSDRPFELRQRGRLIHQFKNLNEAWEKFEWLTNQIRPLAELPPGGQSCLLCKHREPIDDGTQWRCWAKNLTLAIDRDWAKENNGDCRLMVLPEQPRIYPPEFDGPNGVEETFDLTGVAPSPRPLLSPKPGSTIAEEVIEISNPNPDRTAVLRSSGKGSDDRDNDEQYTPDNLWKPMLRVFGVAEFDLDPASYLGDPIPAKKRYTKADNALLQSWESETLWFNFPFSMHSAMEAKLSDERKAGRVKQAGGLIKCDCRPVWFQNFVSQADACCLVAGSWKFGRPEVLEENANSSFFGVVIVYYGEDVAAFYREYNAYGEVMIPVKKMIEA